MTKAKAASSDILLRWIENIPTADVQDPLGTSLRGATRLANRLLFCITSITPRARYFSFIPWCVLDYQQREKEHSYAAGLRQGIKYREHALVLGCVAHHGGRSCPGGALIGIENAVKWFTSHGHGRINFRKESFVKNPALDAYFNSLVNLGVFVTEEDLPELSDEEQPPEMTFEDVELTELGKELATSYRSAIGGLKGAEEIATRQRECRVDLLKRWGQRGGLCELAAESAPDRQLLRDIFFCRRDLKGESHPVRRHSLLFFLELCKKLNDAGWPFRSDTFATSVYYGQVHDDGEVFEVQVSPRLSDIAIRWRMFYFHYYMSAALEGIFSWLVMRLYDAGLTGDSIDNLVGAVDERLVRDSISDALGLDLSCTLGELTPSELFGAFDVSSGPLSVEVSERLDEVIRADSLAAECALEASVRGRQYTYSSSGCAVPLVMLALTIARYRQWNETNVGRWLASTALDPYLDLIPPVVLQSLDRRFDDWWNTSFRALASFLLTRFVIQQHQSMSYVKSKAANRCLLQIDGKRIYATGAYDTIGIRNARFDSAVQVLVDLGLLERDDGKDVTITSDGRRFLKDELAKEAVK